MDKQTLKTNITKKEVNELPIDVFDGEIIIIDDKQKVASATNELLKSQYLGLDTETKPSFKRGVYHKVALIQISTLEKCFLFRLNKIGFPKELSDLLANDNVKKIGLSLRDDFHGLNKQRKIKPSNFIDIQNIAKEYGILELSLQKIYAILFNKKISKSQRLSNWENETLTQQQQKYAATDAWATLKIYKELMKLPKLNKGEIKDLIESKSEKASSNK